MKKFLSLLLAIIMVMSLASVAFADEPVTVSIMFDGSTVSDDVAVLEKLNAYLVEKANIKVQPIWGTWGDFNERAVMALNSGDDTVDMVFTCSWTTNDYMTFAKKGAFVRLNDPENDLIAQYAPDLLASIPAVLLGGATVEGSEGIGIYAVPGYKDCATQNCWDINVTLLEELGYTLADIESRDFYSFGDILAKAKEVKGASFYPLLIEGAVLERMVTNSIIVTGDCADPNLLSYYINPEDPASEGAYGNVLLNKFATPEYEKFVNQVREYYVAGYIDPTCAIADVANDFRDATQREGNYLIGTQSYAMGYEVEASALRGIHVEFVPTSPAYVDTTSSQGALVAINSASKHPVESMKFLSLLNSDPVVMTLLNYGVEGIHYELEDGMVVFNDEARSTYSPWRNGMGNITLLPPQKGEGATYWDDFKAYYGAASSIPVLGWAFNKEDVENETTALANVGVEYALALSCGSIDPAEKLPEFLAKLEAAGMQKFVDEANTQLAAFLAEKSK